MFVRASRDGEFIRPTERECLICGVEFLDTCDAYRCERCQPRWELDCKICGNRFRDVGDYLSCLVCSPRRASRLMPYAEKVGIELADASHELMKQVAENAFALTRRLGRDP